MFTLTVETVGNPDRDQNPLLPHPVDPGFTCAVKDEEEAVRVFSAWRDSSAIGSGNLSRADITHGGKVHARLSYNGRVWQP